MNTAAASEIFVNEIVFTATDVANLYGFVQVEGTYKPIRFVCSMSELLTTLNANGRAGQELMYSIRQTMNQPHASPLTFDLIARFGYTQVIKWNTGFKEERINFLGVKQ